MSDRLKVSRFEICPSLLLRNQNDPVLDRVVTRDEKEFYTIIEDNEDGFGLMSAKPHAFPKAEIPLEKDEGNSVVAGDWRD